MSFPWKPPVKKQAPPRSSFVDGTVRLVASLGYVGYIPIAPGTCGALAAVIVGNRYILSKMPLQPLHYFLIYLALFLLGAWITGMAREVYHTDQWTVIVYDKALGAMIAVSGFKEPVFAQALGRVIVAFAICRLLEIMKVFPINFLEKLPKGWGIMADDVGAGLITLLISVYLPDSVWELIGLGMAKVAGP